MTPCLCTNMPEHERHGGAQPANYSHATTASSCSVDAFDEVGAGESCGGMETGWRRAHLLPV